MKRYQWQGEPVTVTFGMMTVKKNTEKLLYWYNYECVQNAPDERAIILALKIEIGEHVFYISNHCGIGVHKLLNGGWPSHAHFSLPEDGKFEATKMNAIYKFNEECYAQYESERRDWQKKNYPEEFKRSEALRDVIRRKDFHPKPKKAE